jgi:hypothetical protein
MGPPDAVDRKLEGALVILEHDLRAKAEQTL